MLVMVVDALLTLMQSEHEKAVELAKHLREKAAIAGADPLMLEQAELWARTALKWQQAIELRQKYLEDYK